MKKFCKILIAFILSVGFIESVSAADPYYTAIYRTENRAKSSEEYANFVVYQSEDGKSLYASPLNAFTIDEEYQDYDDFWDDADIELIDDDDGEAVKLKPKDGLFKNKKYLHYDMVEDTLFGGRNKLYLGDDYIIDYDYDLILEKTPKYEDSEPNAILTELRCTYGRGKGANIMAGAKVISFEVVRKGSVLSYQVYYDWKPIFNEYKILDEGYSGYDGKIENNIFASYYSTAYINDHFSTKVFWNPVDGSYGCPPVMLMGVNSDTVPGTNCYGMEGCISTPAITTTYVELGWKEIMDKEYEDKTSGWFTIEHSYEYEYGLYQNSSYVEYEQGEKNTEVCIYSSQVCNPDEENCVDNWEYALKESYYSNGISKYELHENTTILGRFSWQNKFKDVYFDIESGLIDTECTNLPIIYTNCTTGDKSSDYYNKTLAGGGNYSSPNVIQKVKDNECVVAATYFKGSQKLYSNKYLDEWDKNAVEEATAETSGLAYKQYMCDLKVKLDLYTTKEKLGKTSNLLFYDKFNENEKLYNIMAIPCYDWKTESNFTCTTDECKSELRYNINKQVRKVLGYCENTYKEFMRVGSNQTLMRSRYNECSAFKKFYQSLVDNEIIDDVLVGCDVFSPDFKNKLLWILDVFKIAGPIMAVILGMIDFTKVIVAGDADKEMKSAWNRFKIRLISALLLFIFPMILSILINIFIGDKIRYNPYCSLFEETPTELVEKES